MKTTILYRFPRLSVAVLGFSLATTAWGGSPSGRSGPSFSPQAWDAAVSTAMTAANTNASPAQRHEALLERARSRAVIPVIVRFKEPTSGQLRAASASGLSRHALLRASQQQTLDQLGLSNGRDRVGAEVKRFQQVAGMAMQADAMDLLDLLADPNVADVVEDVPHPPALSESVPLIGAGPDGTFLGYSGQGQTIAILDTGVDKAHAFLSGKVVSEACYSSNYPTSGVTSLCPGGATQSTATGAGAPCATSISSCHHGTHVAGIAAGRGAGFSGVAKDATVIAIQVFSKFPASQCGGSPCVMAYTSDIIKGLERVHALSSTYQIASANLSLGGGYYTSPCPNDLTSGVINSLASAGIATVIASGNNGYTNATSSPGCVPAAVTVGSTTKSDTVSSFSNSAPFVDLLAPGSSITSSVVGTGYATWNGTSMATPHVSGAWAVLKSVDPTASVDSVLAALQDSGLPILDADSAVTRPRLQIDDAIAALGNDDDGGSPTPLPAAPIASAGSEIASVSFRANWQAAENAGGYRLDVSTRSDFATYLSGYQNLDVSGNTSRSIAGLAPTKTYYYRVRAYNGIGASGNSNAVSVTTAMTPPPFPTVGKPSGIGFDSFTANWTGSKTAAGYRLDVSTDVNFTDFASGYENLDVGSVRSIKVIGLSANTVYYYRVRAYNSGGTSANSRTTSLITQPPPPSPPVVGAASDITATSFRANWSAVAGVTGYRLDVSTRSDFATLVRGYANLNIKQTTLSTLVSKLAPATAYYYRVKAYNRTGVSVSSETVAVTTNLPPPAPPAILPPSSVNSGGFIAKWSAASGATGYTLDVSANSGFATYLAGFQARDMGEATSAEVTGLAPRKVYYYRARSYGPGGKSTLSRTYRVTTSAAGL